MGVNVKDILKLDCLSNAEVIAGHNGLDNIIEYVDVIEMPDIDDWIKSNTLYLTSFYALKEDKLAQIDLIKKMSQVGVAGLVLAPEFYLGHLDEDIIKLADDLKFPIIKLPHESGYADVIKPILGEIFRKSYKSIQKQKIKDFFHNLLTGEFETQEDVFKAAHTMNLDINKIGAVMVVQIDSIKDKEKRKLDRKSTEDNIEFKLSLIDYVIALKEYKNIVVLPILHYDEIDNEETIIDIHLNIANEIKTQIESEIDYVTIAIGIGRYYKNILDISKSYEEAKKALIASRFMTNKILFFDDLKIYKLITKIEDKEELTMFYKEILYPLEIYDEKNGTDLLNTLKVYFECDENMQLSSENLHIHINTMKYRIKRIKDILGIEDFGMDKKVELYLALKIKEIL